MADAIIKCIADILHNKAHEGDLFKLQSRRALTTMKLYKHVENHVIYSLYSDMVYPIAKHCDYHFTRALIAYLYLNLAKSINIHHCDTNMTRILLNEFDLTGFDDLTSKMFLRFEDFEIRQKIVEHPNNIEILPHQHAIASIVFIKYDSATECVTVIGKLFTKLRKTSCGATIHAIFDHLLKSRNKMLFLDGGHYVYLTNTYFDNIDRFRPLSFKMNPFDDHHPFINTYIRECVNRRIVSPITQVWCRLSDISDPTYSFIHAWAERGLFIWWRDPSFRMQLLRAITHLRHAWRQTKNYRIKVILYECFGPTTAIILDQSLSPHEHNMALYAALFDKK